MPDSGIDPLLGKKDQPKDFIITTANLTAPPGQTLPKFKFQGQITTINCCYTDPFQGYLICDEVDLQIKSIEIQLVRAETFEGKTNATEV